MATTFDREEILKLARQAELDVAKLTLAIAPVMDAVVYSKGCGGFSSDVGLHAGSIVMSLLVSLENVRRAQGDIVALLDRVADHPRFQKE